MLYIWRCIFKKYTDNIAVFFLKHAKQGYVLSNY